MRDYNQLVNELRYHFGAVPLILEAADAIERLGKQRDHAFFRLCEWCGVCSKEHRDAWGCDDIARLQELQVPRWIPVEERLPDGSEGDWVLGVANGQVGTSMKLESAIVMVCFDSNTGWWLEEYPDASITVTHWMPLPEPPKEE